MKKLTQERLKELLHYDSDTGSFTWIVNRGNAVTVGDIANYRSGGGYVQIRIDKKLYYGHRLAWLYVYGYFPEHGVDHIDKIRHHNWISNLREASTQCNARNTGNFKHNSSGVKGVTWYDWVHKWCARIKVKGKTKNLGIHEDFTEAVCHRLAAEQCLNWEGCDSNSPAYQYVQKHLK